MLIKNHTLRSQIVYSGGLGYGRKDPQNMVPFLLRYFSILQSVHTCSEVQLPKQWENTAISSAAKRPELEADYSPPYNAEVKKFVMCSIHLHDVVLN
jgi:hypothetical protein